MTKPGATVGTGPGVGVVRGRAAGTANPTILTAVDELTARHRLFHWHLEFPDVFTIPDTDLVNTPTGWTGGFSATLGNPPWERVKLQEQEFFASRDPAIADAKNTAARKKAIAALADTQPELFARFETAKRGSEAESQSLRTAVRFPLCGVGDVNTPIGRSGIITPTGLGTDATTAPFFSDALKTSWLASFFDFVVGQRIWSGIGHNRSRFAVLSMTGGERLPELRLAFDLRHPDDLRQADATFSLTAEEVLMLNPNTGTLAIFQSGVTPTSRSPATESTPS